MRRSLVMALPLALAACATSPTLPPAQDAWFTALSSLCGRAYEGSVREAPAGDTTFAGKVLVMHVRACREDEVRIPFHVGADRSRTWVVTRMDRGLRLKDDHRHEDGTEDAITQYGGDTRGAGSASVQEFFADAHTIELIPAAAPTSGRWRSSRSVLSPTHCDGRARTGDSVSSST